MATQPDQEATNLINAKNGLLKHYTDEQGSSSTRLIGFFAALFALSQGLQRVQDNKAISQSFPKIDEKLYQLSLSNPAFLEMLKFTLLFATLFVLLTFVFRAIFRFATYGLMASELLAVYFEQTGKAANDYIKKKNANRKKDEKELAEKDIDLLFRIHLVVVNNIKKEDHKIYGIFRARWFLEAYNKRREGLWGWLICFSMSTFMTTLVLWFIW